MSQSILSARASIFPCPKCGQMIYSNAEKCRFCSGIVDRQAAAIGAEIQARVNTAYRQAKMLRNSAGAMWTFFVIGLFGSTVFAWGFTGLFFAIPVWLIYWQVKFGRIQTPDPDYKRAKRDWLISLLIWLPALALDLIALGLRLLFKLI